MAKTNSITVEYNQTAQGTKGNDVFHITGATKSATIDLVNSGTDTLYFDVPIQILDDTKVASGTKDLEIFYNRQDADQPGMPFKLTIKNYFSSTAHNATKSSLKNIHFVSRVDGSEHNGSLIDNIQIKNLYTKKDNVITGTNFGDIIEMNYYTDGFVINSGNGNDLISDAYAGKNDIINAGKGNDEIRSYGGDDVLTGGAGNNTYYFRSNTDNNTINLTKNESFNVKFDNTNAKPSAYNFNKFGYSINDKGDAIISYDKTVAESNGVTIKGFANKNITKTATLTLGNNAPIDLKTDVLWDKTITKNYNGSYLNENIDASGAEQQTKKSGKKTVNTNLVIEAGAGNDTITGSDYSDTIKGGAGNDTINGSLKADNITGGAGGNKVVYTNVNQLDGDKIYLTKGENLTIDVSNITSNPDNVSYRISGKDLVVAVNDGVNEKEFTIVNLGTKDVTNNKTKKVADTSSVELKLSDSVTQDLRSEIVAASNAGTYHNDYINRKDDYKLFKDKKKTVIQTDWTKKGLTINGGAGNDTIIGTNYSDTIKAGTGMTEEITGGTGNDKLYASTTANSNTTFVFNAGDGKDTVYSGKGEDTIQINDADLSSFTYEQGTKKNNKDLIIKYTKDDQITIKDYYTVDKKGRITGVNAKNSIKNFVVNGSSVDIGNINNTPTETSEDNKFVCGSSGDDTITVSGNYNVVFAGAGNDEINATGSSGTVYGGEGDDTVNVNANLYTTTTVYGGNGNDTINIGAGNHFVEVFAGTGDNDIVNISAEKQGNTEVHLMKGDGKVTIKGMHSNDNYLDIYTDASCGYVGVKNGTNLEVKLLDNNGNATGDVIIVEEYYLDNGNKNGTVSTNTRVNGSNDFPVNIVKISEGQNGTSQSDYVFGTYSDDTISVGSGYYQHVKTGEGNDVVDLNDANGTTWITFLSGEGNLTIKNASWTQGINLRMDAATADDINFDSFEVRGTDLILKRGEQVLTIEDCLYSSGESVGYLKPNIRIKNNDKPYESGIINLTEYLNSNADFVVYPTDDNKFIIPANSKTATAIFENYEFNNDLTYDNNLTFHKLPDGNLGVYNNNAKVYTLYDSDKNVMVQDSNGDIKTVRYGNSTGYNGGDGDDIIIGTNESYCTIKGNGGNDILIGGQNTEYPTTYHFYKGDGHDILIPQHGSGQVSLQFNDNIKYSDMAYDIEGCGLKILYNKVDNEFQDSVLIENYFSNVSSEQMNNIQISAQTDYACIRNLSDVLAENGLRTSLTTTVEGTENNDLIFGNNNNNVFFGREGSDTIVSNGSWTSIYTNFNPAVENYTNKKDPTAGTVDVVKAYGESNTIYAQSETNYVSSYAANGNDYYNAYLDQKTIIDDKGGNGDSLTITNSYGTIDGRYSIGGNLNTYLFVNVKSYNPENPSECDYDVIVTNNEGKNSLKTGDFANGIYIKNNEIENIWTSDGYKITSAQIATIAQQTAAWLSTNNYDSVSAVIADTEQAGNIDTLVAAIQTNASAMWTAA